MTTPFYNLQIFVAIRGTSAKDDVTMVHSRGIQFAPWPGLQVGLYSEVYGEWRVPLEELTFSFKESSFIANIEDNEHVDSLRETEVIAVKEIVDYYSEFGFKRVTNESVSIRESDNG